MSGKQTTALIIIFIYMALTIVLGLVVSKRKAAKQAKQSNEDFLMAGKSLGPLVLAGTLFAANTGGASTTGIATNVYSYGISACWYVIAAGIGFVLVSFIASYFRKAQASTVPQIIGKRYGKASHIFTAFTSIAALFMATGAQIIATASIINVVTGLDFRNCDHHRSYHLHHGWWIPVCSSSKPDACYRYHRWYGSGDVCHGRKPAGRRLRRTVCKGKNSNRYHRGISGSAQHD